MSEKVAEEKVQQPIPAVVLTIDDVFVTDKECSSDSYSEPLSLAWYVKLVVSTDIRFILSSQTLSASARIMTRARSWPSLTPPSSRLRLFS
jgi:hypothetical protein